MDDITVAIPFKRGLPQRERFLRHVLVVESGCWEWRGHRNHGGYGQFRSDERVRLAHGFAYEEFVGPIPAGLELDHLCRNRGCVNPSHLEPVTRSENLLRSPLMARQQPVLTHCKRGHPFDEANTYRFPNGGRACRICKSASTRRWDLKNKKAS